MYFFTILGSALKRPAVWTGPNHIYQLPRIFLLHKHVICAIFRTKILAWKIAQMVHNLSFVSSFVPQFWHER